MHKGIQGGGLDINNQGRVSKEWAPFQNCSFASFICIFFTERIFSTHQAINWLVCTPEKRHHQLVTGQGQRAFGVGVAYLICFLVTGLVKCEISCMCVEISVHSYEICVHRCEISGHCCETFPGRRKRMHIRSGLAMRLGGGILGLFHPAWRGAFPQPSRLPAAHQPWVCSSGRLGDLGGGILSRRANARSRSSTVLRGRGGWGGKYDTNMNRPNVKPPQ